MRAKASIPAWVKLGAAGVAALALAFLVASPWKQAERDLCAALLENVNMVQRADAERRTSSTFVYVYGGKTSPSIDVTDGDFSGALTLEGVRACLGQGWTETHAVARAEGRGDAWVFSRAGAPLVMVLQGQNGAVERVEMRIVIERASKYAR